MKLPKYAATKMTLDAEGYAAEIFNRIVKRNARKYQEASDLIQRFFTRIIFDECEEHEVEKVLGSEITVRIEFIDPEIVMKLGGVPGGHVHVNITTKPPKDSEEKEEEHKCSGCGKCKE